MLIFSVIFPPLGFIVCHDKEQLKHVNVMCLGCQGRGARLDVEGCGVNWDQAGSGTWLRWSVLHGIPWQARVTCWVITALFVGCFSAYFTFIAKKIQVMPNYTDPGAGAGAVWLLRARRAMRGAAGSRGGSRSTLYLPEVAFTSCQQRDSG